MRRKLAPSYVRGFLIDALLSTMPLREATVFVDRILPSICQELDSSEYEGDDYDIKVAFAKVVMGYIPSGKCYCLCIAFFGFRNSQGGLV